jgi:hypothetical protein
MAPNATANSKVKKVSRVNTVCITKKLPVANYKNAFANDPAISKTENDLPVQLHHIYDAT